MPTACISRVSELKVIGMRDLDCRKWVTNIYHPSHVQTPMFVSAMTTIHDQSGYVRTGGQSWRRNHRPSKFPSPWSTTIPFQHQLLSSYFNTHFPWVYITCPTSISKIVTQGTYNKLRLTTPVDLPVNIKRSSPPGGDRQHTSFRRCQVPGSEWVGWVGHDLCGIGPLFKIFPKITWAGRQQLSDWKLHIVSYIYRIVGRELVRAWSEPNLIRIRISLEWQYAKTWVKNKPRSRGSYVVPK